MSATKQWLLFWSYQQLTNQLSAIPGLWLAAFRLAHTSTRHLVLSGINRTDRYCLNYQVLSGSSGINRTDFPVTRPAWKQPPQLTSSVVSSVKTSSSAATPGSRGEQTFRWPGREWHSAAPVPNLGRVQIECGLRQDACDGVTSLGSDGVNGNDLEFVKTGFEMEQFNLRLHLRVFGKRDGRIAVASPSLAWAPHCTDESGSQNTLYCRSRRYYSDRHWNKPGCDSIHFNRTNLPCENFQWTQLMTQTAFPRSASIQLMNQMVFPGIDPIQLKRKTCDSEFAHGSTQSFMSGRNWFDFICLQMTFSKLNPFE